ncbi:MAG: hypothetical protein AMJ46_12775 [Latescibacteria bacterium DG_63]|nr:MAG: hypothetical protein AMJ46_12775 [Latescibacteria bacterium DG_63]
MNLLVLLLFLLLGIPFIPAIAEYIVRKDKGPRHIPEKTVREAEVDMDIPRLERAREKARAKVAGKVIRIVGDASIPDGTDIDKHLVIHGNLKLGRRCHVFGTVKVSGSVDIGEDSVVEGHVLSEGRIRIGRGSVVKGVVDSTKEIVLEQDTLTEAVSTEKTVELRLGARINRRIVPRDLEADLELMRPAAEEDLRVGGPKTANDRLKDQQEPRKVTAAEERAAPRKEPREEPSELEIFEKLLASKMRETLKRRIEANAKPSPADSQEACNKDKLGRTFLLLILALIALFLAEVAYYSPGSVILPETVLPFGVETWVVFLVLWIGFGLAAGFCTLSTMSHGRRLVENFRGEPVANARYR